MPGSFFDTNVLVYLVVKDPAKKDRVRALFDDGSTISVQVLNEVANVARRKVKLSWPEIHRLMSTLRELLIVHPMTVATHEHGLRLAERYGFATYDAMIVAAALEAGCDTLWSEDMQHGMLVSDRLRIFNPFRAG